MFVASHHVNWRFVTCNKKLFLKRDMKIDSQKVYKGEACIPKIVHNKWYPSISCFTFFVGQWFQISDQVILFQQRMVTVTLHTQWPFLKDRIYYEISTSRFDSINMFQCELNCLGSFVTVNKKENRFNTRPVLYNKIIIA